MSNGGESLFSRILRPRFLRRSADALLQSKASVASWAWRPGVWQNPLKQNSFGNIQNKTPISEEIEVFHDCKNSEISIRQLRNEDEVSSATFGLEIEVSKFEGSFVSLVLDLPESALKGLKKRHIIRMDANLTSENPIVIFARLNIKHGPNTEQIVQELPIANASKVEFDLAYSGANERRIEKMWLDLILENPDSNTIEIRDLSLCRYPRAEL